MDRRSAIMVCLFVLLRVGSTCGADETLPNAESPLFEERIQPIFQSKCGRCHSESVQKGSLDLSSIDAIRSGGESGESLLTESVEDSYLWHVIESGEMPPEGEPALTETEKNLIRDWIRDGAPSRHMTAATTQSIDQHDVLPIVLLRCNTCHGPRLRENGVDLRTRASMIEGGENGPAMIPGDADASPMIQRIESNACPPSDRLLKFFVRRPTQSEVETLRGWIDAGAPMAEVAAEAGSDKLVSDEDRQHWAFQPPRRNQPLSSVDQFIEARLSASGLTLSPLADRDTLIRRAYIDLIGIPPTLDAYRRWHSTDDPDWYALMIDELLASSHYGERWGRYWLDLAGYADSEGGISADPIRPDAWKYRDYVIDAFNSDKPYDRFLIEQLAGDELVDYANVPEITAEIVEQLTATGFLRMGIDETGSRTMNFVPERLKVISDALSVVGSGLMGLTLECARCHSHKYDPIPTRDYYRLKAVFQGALDEHDWDSFKTRKLVVATPEHRKRAKSVNPPLQTELKALQSRQKKLIDMVRLQLLRDHYPKQSEDDNQATLIALKKADNNRTLKQKMLVERLNRAELLPDAKQSETVLEFRSELAEIERAIDRTRREMVPSLSIRALWDQGRPSPTYILRRGEHNKPGELVGPGVPSVLTDGKTPFVVSPPFPEGTSKTGRRLAFAKWLTEPDHPLTARVMVNRIWHHHFGVGLVKDLENFGVKGEPPSHPELLDWLANQFVDQGWSVKALHRLIMNSRTYRQTSRVSEAAYEVDPGNRLLSRMNLTRMDAEALRDSLLSVSGRLDPTAGGLPDTVSVDRDGMVRANPTEGGGWRRSIYLQYRRTEIPTMMDTFDYPQMGPNCLMRNVSTVSPQALMLMNNDRVFELSIDFAERVRSIASPDADSMVDTVYQLALSRMPNEQERRVGVRALSELAVARPDSPEVALQAYCHTILNSASFLFVD